MRAGERQSSGFAEQRFRRHGVPASPSSGFADAGSKQRFRLLGGPEDPVRQPRLRRRAGMTAVAVAVRARVAPSTPACVREAA